MLGNCRRLLLFFLLAKTTFAQTVGVDICACQPATYEFTLDFDLTCEDSTVGGPGINASACIINTDAGQNVTDFRPVIVTNIQILELNQDFEVIAQTPISGNFVNGNTFRYTSVIAGRNADIPAVDVPRGFQLSMAGRNTLEQDLVNFWLIIYNNDCGIFPIILEGQQIGWTILSNLKNPPAALCPLASEPPSAMPSELPTIAPSFGPTPEPTPGTGPPVSDEPSSTPTTIKGVPTETPTTIKGVPTETPSCPPVEHHGKGKGSHLMKRSKKSGKSKKSSKLTNKSSKSGKGKGGSSSKSKGGESTSKSEKSSGKGKGYSKSPSSKSGGTGKGSGKGSSKSSDSKSSKSKGKGGDSKSKSGEGKGSKSKKSKTSTKKKSYKHSSKSMHKLIKTQAPTEYPTVYPTGCPEPYDEDWYGKGKGGGKGYTKMPNSSGKGGGKGYGNGYGKGKGTAYAPTESPYPTTYTKGKGSGKGKGKGSDGDEPSLSPTTIKGVPLSSEIEEADVFKDLLETVEEDNVVTPKELTPEGALEVFQNLLQTKMPSSVSVAEPVVTTMGSSGESQPVGDSESNLFVRRPT